MQLFKTIPQTINKLFNRIGYNDNATNIYFMTMLLALFAPSLFFTQDFNFLRTGIILYAIVSLAWIRYNKRIDIGNNLHNWLIYGFFTYVIVSMINSQQIVQTLPFTNNVAQFFWQVFVIGFSETIIRIKVFQMFNPFIGSVLMGLLHSTSYMLMLGNYIFTPELFIYLGMSVIAFFIFSIVYKYSGNNAMTEALVHGMYNIGVTGGFI
jgi:hypothetical protein